MILLLLLLMLLLSIDFSLAAAAVDDAIDLIAAAAAAAANRILIQLVWLLMINLFVLAVIDDMIDLSSLFLCCRSIYHWLLLSLSIDLSAVD
jgi:hypothetical protein